MAFSFSVQLYSVRTVIKEEPLNVLRKLKAMGYDGVEGFGNFEYSPSDITYALSSSGLTLAGYHTPWENVQDETLNSTIKYFKEIANKYVIIPGLPDECTKSIEAWKRTAEKFNSLSNRLQKDGMKLGYHNHDTEFRVMDGQMPYTVFLDNTDPEVVMQIDNGNALAGGADFMSILRKYPGRFASVHLKPYSKKSGYAPVIGEDDIDWKEFLHWCRDNGGTEHFIVEYEQDEVHPQIEGVDLCIKALKKMELDGKL